MDEIEEESLEDRYQRYSRHEKLALLMIALGPQAASTLLKRFDPKDSESICKKMGDFPIVNQLLRDLVLDEFSEIIESSVNSNLGGFSFAQKSLELAHGGFKANSIMNRIAPAGDSLDFMDDIKDMDTGQIYNVLRFEQPQTIAFILANLESDKSSEVIKLMPPNVQEQVIERVAAMDTTPLAQVRLVADTLGNRMSSKSESPRVLSGGIKVAADLLNWFGKEEGKELLKSIEKRNPKLGGSIRQRMFRFEDIVRLSPGDISKITKEVDQDDLVISMKNASAELKKAIYATMSKRAVEALEEQLSFLGPKRLSEIESAQDRVIQIVRELEEDEEIILDTGGSDIVVQ
jgi:flagellar motor switch protein FliG